MFLRICLIAIGLSVSSCGPKVKGVVVDMFNSPLNGVKIEILEKKKESSSANSGEYALPAEIGKYKMRFSKEGYTTHTIEINVLKDSTFHLDTLTMYPNPKEKAVYLVQDKHLVKLLPTMLQDYIRADGPAMLHRKTTIIDSYDAGMEINSEDGRLLFIDNIADQIGLMQKASNGRTVQSRDRTAFDTDDHMIYYGFVTSSGWPVGDEQVMVRRVDVQKGAPYTWATGTYEKRNRRFLVNAKGSCYSFYVKNN